jgi:alginate O-acetyltransferase complex protein AlgJ
MANAAQRARDRRPTLGPDVRVTVDAGRARRGPWDAILTVLFVAIISLPLAANLGGHDGADPEAENRELASMPHLTASRRSIVAYTEGFGRWFEDHFGFRAALVRWYGESRYFWLGVSPSPAVIKGRDGWLFYADDGGAEDATNESLLEPGELEAWRASLIKTRDWLHRRGIAYVFTIAPDKHVVYPENLPSTLNRVNLMSRGDQLEKVCREAAIPVADLRAAVAAAKQPDRIYFKTDTHWNDRGAFVAYRQIIAAVRTQAPLVPEAWTRDDFVPAEREIEGQDLARMIGLMRVLREMDLTLVARRIRHAQVVEPAGAPPTAEEGRLVTEIPGSTLPRAVVFRDSFASRLVPFLSEHFSRAVYLWQNDFDSDVIEQEHPDVVIQEIVSRHLYVFTPSPELIPN